MHDLFHNYIFTWNTMICRLGCSLSIAFVKNSSKVATIGFMPLHETVNIFTVLKASAGVISRVDFVFTSTTSSEI